MSAVDPFKAPVVSSLSVRVVVDSVFDQFMPKATHPMCTIEHVGRIHSNLNSTLAGEWGLSLHLEFRAGGATGQYLLDFGYTPEILTRNFDLLGIEPERLNGLILSHGHRDHYGGLGGFVAHYRDRMRDDLRLFAGGKEAFREKWVGSRDEEPASWGALDRAALEAAHVETVYCECRPCTRRSVHDWQYRAPVFRKGIAQHAGRADGLRSLQRGRAARHAWCPTAIPMSMRRVMSCRDAAWWWSRPAAIVG